MPEPVPSPIRIVEPDRQAGPPATLPLPSPVRDAARRVLARDGRDLVLQPWQVAYLVAVTEGREAFVPPGCGVGRGWLEARLGEELARG